MIRLGGPILDPPNDPEELARAHLTWGYRAAYCPKIPLSDTNRIRETRRAFKKYDVLIAEVGATVIVASGNKEKCRELAKEFSNRKLKVYGEELDQSDESSAKGLLIHIKKEFGILQILVNCAVHRPMKRYYEDDISAWDESMSVNARGLFVMCRVLVKIANGS